MKFLIGDATLAVDTNRLVLQMPEHIGSRSIVCCVCVVIVPDCCNVLCCAPFTSTQLTVGAQKKKPLLVAVTVALNTTGKNADELVGQLRSSETLDDHVVAFAPNSIGG